MSVRVTSVLLYICVRLQTDRESQKATVRTCNGALFGSATCKISLLRP